MVPRRTSGNPTPAYFKLQKQLQDEIESGGLAPQERVPPERRLAELHKVSIGTVTKAIMNLVNQGYLYRVQGSGTFVAGTTLRRESLRYYRALREFGDEEADLKITLLELKLLEGIDPINRHLKIESSQGLYQLRRLLVSEERPMVYSISYLPQKMFKGLETFPSSRFEKIPLYSLVEESYGQPTIFNRELLSVMSAESNIATTLAIQEGTPLLLIEMLAFTYKERPYEYRQSYCLTDIRKIFREY
jgi:GntR family transcriptional regulator